MDRELIIIGICIIVVGFLYLQSDDASSAYPLEQEKRPVSIQNTVEDTINTELPNSLGR